jgi:hypothetical protein
MQLLARELKLTTAETGSRREFELAFGLVSRAAFLLARHLGRVTDTARDLVEEAKK